MTTPRTVALGLGVFLLLGLSFATLTRAQKTQDQSDHAAPAQTGARERLLKLRSELDVTQLEYDGVRAALMEVIREADKTEITSDIDVFKEDKELKKRLDRKKQAFAKQARFLNQKKLELAEAEKQYQREIQ